MVGECSLFAHPFPKVEFGIEPPIYEIELNPLRDRTQPIRRHLYFLKSTALASHNSLVTYFLTPVYRFVWQNYIHFCADD